MVPPRLSACSLLAAAVVAFPVPARANALGAQQLLGAVVCVGSERETLATGAEKSGAAVRESTEIAARIGVPPLTLDNAERDLRTELARYGDVRCARSGPGHSHVVVISYMGVVKREPASDAGDLLLRSYAVGYGASWREAEDEATTLNERFANDNDGSGYEVVVRETWGAGAPGAGTDRGGSGRRGRADPRHRPRPRGRGDRLAGADLAARERRAR